MEITGCNTALPAKKANVYYVSQFFAPLDPMVVFGLNEHQILLAQADQLCVLRKCLVFSC